MDENANGNELVELAADIVSAYVSNNTVVAADLPALIGDTFDALSKAAARAAEPIKEELKPSVPVEITGLSGESIPSLPTELAKETAERMREAVEMGNVNELKAIAETLKARFGEFAGLGEKIRQMAEDFDFDALI